jgi:hypothetical protein
MSRQARHTVTDATDLDETLRLVTPGPNPQRTQHRLELRRSNASGLHRARGSRSDRRRQAIRESAVAGR